MTLNLVAVCVKAEEVKELVTQEVAEKCGLEYKLMVKSVDPDGTTAVTEHEPDDVLPFVNRDLNKEGEEEEKEEYGDKMGEMTSPAPVIREENGILPNRTDSPDAEWGQRKKRRVFGANTAVPATDRCLEPMSEGACTEYVLLWYFHPRSGECRPFVFGGCGGNGNRFSSRQECQSWCEVERRGGGVPIR
ncbi:uncharacterized protein [Chaetodon trifascialis]|uniref:uncharacterized protein n=1 Tax=Chaetodon trifascialis TaxID=109706 RepID=UPI003994311C